MFEFGRDLRKLFEKARESEDLGWLELVGADLVQLEARRESVDAGPPNRSKRSRWISLDSTATAAV